MGCSVQSVLFLVPTLGFLVLLNKQFYPTSAVKEHLKILKSPRVLFPNTAPFVCTVVHPFVPCGLTRNSTSGGLFHVAHGCHSDTFEKGLVFIYCYLRNHPLVPIPLRVIHFHGAPATLAHARGHFLCPHHHGLPRGCALCLSKLRPAR